MNRISRHQLAASDEFKIGEPNVRLVAVLECERVRARDAAAAFLPEQDVCRLPVARPWHPAAVAHLRVEVAVHRALTADRPPIPAGLTLPKLRLSHPTWRIARTSKTLVRRHVTFCESVPGTDVVTAAEPTCRWAGEILGGFVDPKLRRATVDG